MTLINSTKSKTNKINHIIKINKTNSCSIINSIVFESLKISMDLKNCHLILGTKDQMTSKKRFNRLKTVNPQTDQNKNLQKKF